MADAKDVIRIIKNKERQKGFDEGCLFGIKTCYQLLTTTKQQEAMEIILEEIQAREKSNE